METTKYTSHYICKIFLLAGWTNSTCLSNTYSNIFWNHIYIVSIMHQMGLFFIQKSSGTKEGLVQTVVCPISLLTREIGSCKRHHLQRLPTSNVPGGRNNWVREAELLHGGYFSLFRLKKNGWRTLAAEAWNRMDMRFFLYGGVHLQTVQFCCVRGFSASV